ncbi:UNVERIFIED_CONTAM: Ran-binding protein 10 [Siphonaria sp. JEL0065]|nr:Ran-binding protein 10 [Siphonaria sp. JEL0065]
MSFFGSFGLDSDAEIIYAINNHNESEDEEEQEEEEDEFNGFTEDEADPMDTTQDHPPATTQATTHSLPNYSTQVIAPYVLMQVQSSSGSGNFDPTSNSNLTNASNKEPLFLRVASAPFLNPKLLRSIDLGSVPATQINKSYSLFSTGTTHNTTSSSAASSVSTDSSSEYRHKPGASASSLLLQTANSQTRATSSEPAATHSSRPLHNNNPHLDKLAKSLPSHFAYDHHSRKDNNEMISLSNKGLVATYVGPGLSDRHSAAVRVNRSIPRDFPVFYFEVRVLSKGKEGWMGMGCCARNVDLDRLPGWDPISYGYHGDDGFKFESSGKGKPYGPTYTTGDYIGCIVNYQENTMSFTKNGTLIGVAFKILKPDLPLYPQVGFRTPGESMQINFGLEAFKFDIEGYVLEQQIKVWKTVHPVQIPIPPSLQPASLATNPVFIDASKNLRTQRFSEFPDLLLHDLILEHLEHVGYHETAAVFRETIADLDVVDGISDLTKNRKQFLKKSTDVNNTTGTENAMDVDDLIDLSSIKIQKQLRSKIMNGDISTALQLIESQFPNLLSKNRHVYFALLCRQFIEAVNCSLQQQQQEIPHPFTSWEDYLISLGRRMNGLFQEEAETNSLVNAALLETFSLVAYSVDSLVLAQQQQLEKSSSSGGVRRSASPCKHSSAERNSTRSSSESLKSSASSITSMPSVPASVLRLLSPVFRDSLASLVDTSVLQEMGKLTDSVLERELKQCVLVSQLLGENGGPVVGSVDLIESVWRDS